MRREKKKRLYVGYFKKGGLLKTLRFFYYLNTKKKEFEPSVEKFNNINSDTIFVFNKIFTDYDFFKETRSYKEIVRKGIIEMLHPELQEQYNNYEKPVIGLHIRRGDFKRGSTITPLSFFIEVVNSLRKEAASDLPVTIFTDAEPAEIEELARLNGVRIAEPKADILDILLLAASQVAVLSIGSTFSYWAGFLSQGKIIKHPGEWHVPFKSIDDLKYSDEILWSGKSKAVLIPDHLQGDA